MLPVKGICKTVRRRFTSGSEPTKFCNTRLHGR
jgi:hypothetical protein